LKTTHFLDSSAQFTDAPVQFRGVRARTILTALAALAALSVPAIADAQTKGKAKAARTVSFEDDVIEATYIRPEGGTIDVKQNQRQSLIRIRTNFFAELFRSAEDL
jgi:hypothetical protein